MEFNNSLETAISPERFATYRTLTHGDDDLAWELYRWNLKLVGALSPLLADFEVTLRNTIHHQLTERFEQETWWASPRLILDENTSEMLRPTLSKHRRRLAKGSVKPGRVVADLTFGVWVNLLSKGGHSTTHQVVNYEQRLWRDAISRGFQVGNELNARGNPKRPLRRDAHSIAANLQALRNAASHHRRIGEGIRPPGSAPEIARIPLTQIREQAITMLGWMCEPLASLHRSDTSLLEIWDQRPSIATNQ